MHRTFLSVGLIGLSSLVLVSATKAYFSSQAVSAGNKITAGTLSVALNGHGSQTLPFNVDNLAPGDGFAQCVKVSNSGTLPFDWSFTLVNTSGSTPGLHDVLKARVYLWNDATAPVDSDCAVGEGGQWTVLGDQYLTEYVFPQNVGSLASLVDGYFKLEFYLEPDLRQAGDVDVSDNDYQGAWSEYSLQVDAVQQP